MFINRRIMQRAAILFLILTVLIFQYRQQKAEAFLPLLVNPWTIAALTALTAAGVTISRNPSAAKAIAADFYNSIKDYNVKNSLVWSASADYVHMTEGMWGAVKDYVRGTLMGYKDGTTFEYATSEDGSAVGTSLPWRSTTDGLGRAITNDIRFYKVATAPDTGTRDTYASTRANDGVGLTSANSVETIQQPYAARLMVDLGANASETIYGYQISGYVNGLAGHDFTPADIKFYGATGALLSQQTFNPSTNMSLAGVYFGLTPISGVRYIGLAANTDGNNLVNYGEIQFFTTNPTTPSTVINNYTYNTGDVSIDQRYADSTTDLANRQITVPKKADGTSVKTAEDWIANPATTVPGAVVVSDPIAGATSATQTGLLSGILTGVNSLTYTGGLADPAAKAQTLSAIFTTKFPFSLPWDLSSLVGAVAATPVRPEIHVDRILSLGGYAMPMKFDITFSFLDQFIGFFRTFEILAFCGFLIASTRRLLGGAQ